MLYKEAVRLKVRFSYKGQLSIEDLWDLSLTALDHIYSQLTAEQKNLQSGGLLAKPTKESELVDLKLSLVKDVFETKQAVAEEAKQVAEKKARKQRILEILENKQDESLKNLSVEELKQLANSL
jgi:hypothetical protein